MWMPRFHDSALSFSTLPFSEASFASLSKFLETVVQIPGHSTESRTLRREFVGR